MFNTKKNYNKKPKIKKMNRRNFPIKVTSKIEQKLQAMQ